MKIKKKVKLCIPRNELDAHMIARVMIHEIYHNLGLTHKEMVPIESIATPFAAEYVVERK